MVRVREFAGVAAVAMIAMSAAIGVQRFESNKDAQAVVAAWIPSFIHPADAAPEKLVRVADNAPIIQLGKPTPIVPIPPANKPAAPAPVAPVAPPPVDNAYMQADAVAERIRDSVPSELFGYFDVYLYVSKAANGAWAQHMFVYHRAGERLAFEETFPVSTGREQQEKYFTTTPVGLFELDPDRFDANHHSHRWHNAPMPWAMFLNYTIHDHLAGVALHSGVGHVADLGHRASGGCVRMPPERAEEFFKRFKSEEYGMVPVFGFDEASGTTLTDGQVLRTADGRVALQPGYRVLLIIQNYSGGEPAMVAVLS